MDRRKIVIIGAGSAMFTQGLVADLIVSGKSWTLGLVDTSSQALMTAEGLTSRMVKAAAVDIRVEASQDRRDVLPGADVVVSTIGVGGRRAWLADVVIPRRYGVYQPVGDSVMAGGISRALRMVPAMVEIARDVLKLAPTSHFFNYANPMTVICAAVRKATGADMVGLCSGVHDEIQQLAGLIGAPTGEVTALAAGLNHFTWIWDLRWRGQDAWPLVWEKLAQERDRMGTTGKQSQANAPGSDTTLLDENESASTFVSSNRFSWSLFDTYGAFPSAGDRHVIEFFPERFPEGSYYGMTAGVNVFSLEETISWGDRVYECMRATAMGEAPLDDRVLQSAAGEHSQLLDILDSIEGDRRRSDTANLPNRGAVPNLPDDAILEITSVATARGLRPIPMPDFPLLLATPLSRSIAAQALTVEAALSGSRKVFVEALTADGSVTDPSVAERLAAELLKEHKDYLPQFA